MKARDKYESEYRKARRLVLKRDGGVCVKCGSSVRIEVHHGPQDNSLEHLRTLCYPCHGIAPMDDPYWEWEEHGPTGFDKMMEFLDGKIPDLLEQCRMSLEANPNIMNEIEEITRYYKEA